MKSKRIIIILGLILCFQHNTIVAGVETMEIFDFKKLETSGRWFIVNDGVMGGVSESNVSWEPEGFLVFEGILSLDYGGGFASTRTWSDDWQMGGYEGIILSVRGDGRKYQFRCRLENTSDGISYRHSFATVKGEWLEIVLPFDEFEPGFRGRLLPDQPKIDPTFIRQIGFMITDKQQGDFRLEVKMIGLYLKS